ncbi:alpha/beta hydrolase [Streptomyces sp. NPDC057579]|uniref:alpha/beta hydrolase n=1 Tax=Streptomyces sp. NPDC057579 TaxID=3346172 RepID=UPI0036BFE13E
MRNRITRRAALLTVGLAAASQALTPATDFTASTSARASTAEESLRRYTQQKLQWKRCDTKGPDTLQCATLTVPLDYSDPDGKAIGLAISRLKASSTKERRGVLLLNPGGPGAPGLDLPAGRLQKAAEGNNPAEGNTPTPSGTPGQAEESDDNYASIAWSVMCADTRTWSHDPERYRREAIRDKARDPLYGDFAATIKPCAFWRQGSEPQSRIDNTVGALITQNEWDPQTPLFAGQAMHRALRGSRMLTVAGGEGDGVLYAPDGNTCADTAATAYLTTGRLPAKDLTCRATAGRKQQPGTLPGAGQSRRTRRPAPECTSRPGTLRHGGEGSAGAGAPSPA